MTILGLDVSLNQPPNFPWQAAREWGARFVIIRATSGITLDHGYPKHREYARAAELWTGSYAYIYPQLDMAQQARVFCREVVGNDDEFWPVVDVEEPGLTLDLLREWEWEFARHVDMTLRPLMIYTSAYLWHLLMGTETTEFGGYHLWCGDYGPGTLTSVPLKPAPSLPHPWHKATIYQYAGDNGRMPGYGGRIDLDLMSEELEAVKRLQGTALAALIQAQTIVTNMTEPPPPPPPPKPWWQTLALSWGTRNPNRVVTFYHADGAVFNPQPITRPVTWVMTVVEINVERELLRVTDWKDRENWWVKPEPDLQP